jgi:actin related protein 2/3 complex subunit 5
VQAVHLNTVTEILQSIRQAEMTPILQRIYQSEGGSELCDTLMKYLYKGMGLVAPPATNSASRNSAGQAGGFTQASGRNFGGGEGGGQAMSVLLSWHEKVCEVRYYEMKSGTDRCHSSWRWQDLVALSASCRIEGQYERGQP